MATTKQNLRDLSEKRLEGIKILHEHGYYDLVNQDSGYVLEFGLKSAVCTQMGQNDYPDHDPKFRTHSLNKLVNMANLRGELDKKRKSDRNFFLNWSLLSKWSVEFRYEPIGSSSKENSEDIINALENPKDGVHPWVKSVW